MQYCNLFSKFISCCVGVPAFEPDPLLGASDQVYAYLVRIHLGFEGRTLLCLLHWPRALKLSVYVSWV